MASQNSNKGNPAMKRMQNKNLAAKRERCWWNGQARKKARREAQDAAHKRNIERGYTEWDKAKEARRALRGG